MFATRTHAVLMLSAIAVGVLVQGEHFKYHPEDAEWEDDDGAPINSAPDEVTTPNNNNYNNSFDNNNYYDKVMRAQEELREMFDTDDLASQALSQGFQNAKDVFTVARNTTLSSDTKQGTILQILNQVARGMANVMNEMDGKPQQKDWNMPVAPKTLRNSLRYMFAFGPFLAKLAKVTVTFVAGLLIAGVSLVLIKINNNF